MKYIIYLLIGFGFYAGVNHDPATKGKPDLQSAIIASVLWPVQIGEILAYQWTDDVLLRVRKK